MKGRKAQKGLNWHTSKLRHLWEHCLEADGNFSTDCKKGSDLAEAVAGRWVPAGCWSSIVLCLASCPDH